MLLVVPGVLWVDPASRVGLTPSADMPRKAARGSRHKPRSHDTSRDTWTKLMARSGDEVAEKRRSRW